MEDTVEDFRVYFKNRTKNFALRVIKLFQKLPNTDEAKILGKQLLRSATSVASNYRASLRARSKAEFIAKMGIVVEEADESLFWIKLLIESKIVLESLLIDLKQEVSELLAIAAKTRSTAIQNQKKTKNIEPKN
jgi:four helix bundle protein